LLGFVVATMAAPINVYYGRNPMGQVYLAGVPWPVWVLLPAGFALGVCAIWMPLRAGIKHLRGLEF
jgi:hypothetical protein